MTLHPCYKWKLRRLGPHCVAYVPSFDPFYVGLVGVASPKNLCGSYAEPLVIVTFIRRNG